MAEQEIKSKKITKDSLISDILVDNEDKASLLAEVMMDFGIHCFACGAAAFETLEQGVLGHGYSEKELNKLVKDLNKIVGGDDSKKIQKRKSFDINFDLNISKKALEKIKNAMEKSNRENPILRISAIKSCNCTFKYHMEFLDSPTSSDISFKKSGVDVAVDKDSMDLVNGSEIDYVEGKNDSGFKFNNPNEKPSCGCHN